jgi:hypothetical protein
MEAQRLGRTPAADALMRNNRTTARLAGRRAWPIHGEASQLPSGEKVEKQLVVINDSREAVSCDCEWSASFRARSRYRKVNIPAGSQERIPLTFAVPSALAPGEHFIYAKVVFSTGETQSDSFPIHVLQPVEPHLYRRRLRWSTEGRGRVHFSSAPVYRLNLLMPRAIFPLSTFSSWAKPRSAQQVQHRTSRVFAMVSR